MSATPHRPLAAALWMGGAIFSFTAIFERECFENNKRKRGTHPDTEFHYTP